MELDDFAKGAVASLLTDQVIAKTGLAFRVAGVIAAVAVVAAFLAAGWLRWLMVIVVLFGVAALLFVAVTKRVSLSLINRIAPPADLGNARQHFESAIEEADIPTGPTGFLRFIWRLRKGIGPEVERLASVVSRLKSQLG